MRLGFTRRGIKPPSGPAGLAARGPTCSRCEHYKHFPLVYRGTCQRILYVWHALQRTYLSLRSFGLTLCRMKWPPSALLLYNCKALFYFSFAPPPSLAASQIPKGSDPLAGVAGLNVRDAFAASRSFTLLAADYSQIEVCYHRLELRYPNLSRAGRLRTAENDAYLVGQEHLKRAIML